MSSNSSPVKSSTDVQLSKSINCDNTSGEVVSDVLLSDDTVSLNTKVLKNSESEIQEPDNSCSAALSKLQNSFDLALDNHRSPATDIDSQKSLSNALNLDCENIQTNTNLDVVKDKNVENQCVKTVEANLEIHQRGSEGSYSKFADLSQAEKTEHEAEEPSVLKNISLKDVEKARVAEYTSKEIQENVLVEKSKIYCSTPVTDFVKNKNEINIQKSAKDSGDNNDFGRISPLNSTVTNTSSSILQPYKNKMNLKRKKLNLECIEEASEDISNPLHEKKPKLSIVEEEVKNDEADISSSVPCFEAPAKSILKKWQPSCFSKNSVSSTFLVLDECGDSDTEEGIKSSQDCMESNVADDFENEYKSLTEELLKGSYNIETLEKYHSQVQLESQMDDEKFDEVLQELNIEIDGKTSSSLKPLAESLITDENKTSLTIKSMDESFVKNTEISLNSQSVSSDSYLIAKHDENKTRDSNCSSTTECSERQGKEKPITSLPNSEKVLLEEKNTPNVDVGSTQTSELNVDNEEKIMDEEDFLLEEDVNTETKPYVFFEFVSSDPKENEDNYNPEWQKLGKLTSDEERYKAVRDRWRSLVPPDPNRDLTCRQWRKKNNKPPLNISALNNNRRVDDDLDRNQLCTAVFERKIERMMEDLKASRMNIIKQREIDFQTLANDQDEEQRELILRGGQAYDLTLLHRRHIEQCRRLKETHDLEINRIKSITEEKIRILKNASEEVLLFQKFYKGVGASGDKVSTYLTDIQVQELMETEEMLEQYSNFYR